MSANGECSRGASAEDEDASFRSSSLAEKVRQHHLWHGDLLADAQSFATFRAWVEERLPRVTQTAEGYFTAALVRAVPMSCLGKQCVRRRRRRRRVARRRARSRSALGMAPLGCGRGRVIWGGQALTLWPRSRTSVATTLFCTAGGCQQDHPRGARPRHPAVRNLPVDPGRLKRAPRTPPTTPSGLTAAAHSLLSLLSTFQVALALFVAGETAPAARAVSALGALYGRADHAAVMDKMTGAPFPTPRSLLCAARSHAIHTAAARGAGYDNFTCAPVRFTCPSGERTDPWAHMQLDALGLFLVSYGTLAAQGLICADVALVSRFVRYLGAIEYWTRADLGHWEEWPAAVRTSSLGCCVAGLRAVAPLLRQEEGDCAGVALACEEEALQLAQQGAQVLATRLGGQEGTGVAWEAPGRADDAALLTLLLPPIAAQLALSPQQRCAVAESALRLRRPHGVLRYEGDSYYGADYQQRLRAWKGEHGGGDASAYPQAQVRDSWAVAGCEAQWTIFEPLLLLHFLHLHATQPGPYSAREVRRSLMRVLAAVEEEEEEGGAVRLHVHESYTVVQGTRGPNDVQDLLWAVAYIRMGLAACAEFLAAGGQF